MHRKTPVLEATYSTSQHRFTRLLSVMNVSHAPVAAFDSKGRVTLAGLNDWWSSRAIPRTRDGFGRMASALSLRDPAQLLKDSSDYAYEPLPFGLVGNPDSIPDPAAQLSMLGDWRWYEAGMFDDAPNIVRETLSENPNMPPARIERVVRGVEHNVRVVEARAKGRAYRGNCTERMCAAGKRVDPLPCMLSAS